MTLEAAYADGQLAALQCYKLGWPSATDPTVADSAVLQSQSTKPTSPAAQANMQPPTTPQSLLQIFDAHEQGKTRTEPRRKLSADNLCTTCRKEKHYGPCDSPRKIPTKVADFNIGMRGDDPRMGENPSTSPHYHAATTADSSLAKARDAQPADVQAQTAFADIFRHQGIRNSADEPGRMTGGLWKTALKAALVRTFPPKLGNWQMWGTDGHSRWEQRGPSDTPNFYEEKLYRKGPPLGWGDEGPQRIERAFDQIDNAVDSTNIEDASKGQPSGGPAV
jgi:hypothetical protein